MPPRSAPSSFEILEARIAPAAVSGSTFSYTDVDGDKVRITFSHGDVSAATFGFDTGTAEDASLPHQLQLIDLNQDGSFDGADISVQVQRARGGDGSAAIGRIQAAGIYLGKVTIAGDLGSIMADSNTDPAVPAIRLLQVESMGRYGLLTQSDGTAVSEIQGATIALGGPAGLAVGALVVAGDVTGVHLDVTGSIGAITIGGSLVGTADFESGEITATEKIGPIRIRGDVLGGEDARSGNISANALASVFVGGSLLGSDGDNSASIGAFLDLGPVTIMHDVRGGRGAGSGALGSANGHLASVRILGSLIGGAGDQSGSIATQSTPDAPTGGIGGIFIGHDLVGGAGMQSGWVTADRDIGNVTVGGSVFGGSGYESGGVHSGARLGAVLVHHDVLGGGDYLSGSVTGDRGIRGVAIGGSLVGGTASDAGVIEAQDLDVTVASDIGHLWIGHNVIGGSIGETDESLSRSGCIVSSGQIGSVFILGSVVSGIDGSTEGDLDASGSIRAGHDLPFLYVGGSLVGHHTASGDSPVVISAQGQGQVPASARSDRGFGEIVIRGRVEWSRILAGYDLSAEAVDGNAQIGQVHVGGSWIASTLVAGVENANGIANLGADGGAGDRVIARAQGEPAVSLARIAGIAIEGAVIGDATGSSGSTHFGFASANRFPLLVGGAVVPLAPDVLSLSPITGDVVVHRAVTR